MKHPYDKTQNPTPQQFEKLMYQLSDVREDYQPLMELFQDTGDGAGFNERCIATDRLSKALEDFNRFEISMLIKGLDKGDKTAVLQVVHFLDDVEDKKAFWIDKQFLSLNFN